MKTGNLLLPVMVCTCIKLSAAVTMTESQVEWKTFTHTVNADYSLQNDTFSTDIATHTYKSLVLENEYLKVTLVPEFGGRILSLIYKPTGHEQLYQNPVGTPYGPDWDAFYYDWLMVWGGIFPTFPEAEHGKAWCRPWEYTIVTNTAEEVSVEMSFTDTINFGRHPSQFKYGATGITCRFKVTLAAKTSVLKTSVTLANSKDSEIPYEYWTNVSVAPGSVPGSAGCDDQTEIVGPVSKVKIAADWPEIRTAEQNESGDIYRFNNLRWYKNWADDGIAYAWPVEGNFWGALNHKNNEAILRISENVKTPGLKLWGFGYNRSRTITPETSTDYHRPFLELWAGASKEFFTPAKLAVNAVLQFDEYYTPVVGLSSFTHANEHAAIDLSTDKESYNGSSDNSAVASCRYFVTEPAAAVTVLMQFRGSNNTVTVHEEIKTPDTNGPFEIRDTIPVKNLCDDIDRLVFELRSGNDTLMHAEVPVTVSGAGTCAASVKPDARTPRLSRMSTKTSVPEKRYSINGVCLGDIRTPGARSPLRNGIYLSIDNTGRCRRVINLQY